MGRSCPISSVDTMATVNSTIATVNDLQLYTLLLSALFRDSRYGEKASVLDIVRGI